MPKKRSEKSLDSSSDDFASPTVFKKIGGADIVPKRTKTLAKCKKKLKHQPTLLEALNAQFKLSDNDVNPDHLQTALALSESLSPQQARKESHNGNGQTSSLLRFVFKTGKGTARCGNESFQKELQLTKKSKYRHITPVLFIRTEQDRNILIQTKISSVLNQNGNENTPKLECNKKSRIFSDKLASIERHGPCSILNVDASAYKVAELNISMCGSKCGCSLNDWRKIPLRDPSPESREEENVELYTCLQKDQMTVEQCPSSPDLFADYESEASIQSGKKRSPIIRNEEDDAIIGEMELDSSPDVCRHELSSISQITNEIRTDSNSSAENPSENGSSLTSFHINDASMIKSLHETDDGGDDDDDDCLDLPKFSQKIRENSIVIVSSSEDDESIDSRNNMSGDVEEIQAASYAHVKTLEQTPSSKIALKSDGATPRLNYESMSTPELTEELDKFGVRPLKRNGAVSLLERFYDLTHPPVVVATAAAAAAPEDVEKREIVRNHGTAFEKFDVHLHADTDDSQLIFERSKRGKKVSSSCVIPLQIVWHNFLQENLQIREKILTYEPLHVEVIRGMLSDVGFEFHIEDLTAFLDQKCITIRQQSRNGNGGVVDDVVS